MKKETRTAFSPRARRRRHLDSLHSCLKVLHLFLRSTISELDEVGCVGLRIHRKQDEEDSWTTCTHPCLDVISKSHLMGPKHAVILCSKTGAVRLLSGKRFSSQDGLSSARVSAAFGTTTVSAETLIELSISNVMAARNRWFKRIPISNDSNDIAIDCDVGLGMDSTRSHDLAPLPPALWTPAH